MKKIILAVLGFVIAGGALSACTPEVRDEVSVTQTANPNNSSVSDSGLGLGFAI